MLSPFKKIKVDDFTDVTRVQDNINNAITPLLKASIIDGRLLTNVALASGGTAGTVNNVAHGLGRVIQGYIVVGQSQLAFITREDIANPANPDRFLNLTASNATTVSLWVF